MQCVCGRRQTRPDPIMFCEGVHFALLDTQSPPQPIHEERGYVEVSQVYDVHHEDKLVWLSDQTERVFGAKAVELRVSGSAGTPFPCFGSVYCFLSRMGRVSQDESSSVGRRVFVMRCGKLARKRQFFAGFGDSRDSSAVFYLGFLLACAEFLKLRYPDRALPGEFKNLLDRLRSVKDSTSVDSYLRSFVEYLKCRDVLEAQSPSGASPFSDTVFVPVGLILTDPWPSRASDLQAVKLTIKLSVVSFPGGDNVEPIIRSYTYSTRYTSGSLQVELSGVSFDRSDELHIQVQLTEGQRQTRLLSVQVLAAMGMSREEPRIVVDRSHIHPSVLAVKVPQSFQLTLVGDLLPRVAASYLESSLSFMHSITLGVEGVTAVPVQASANILQIPASSFSAPNSFLVPAPGSLPLYESPTAKDMALAFRFDRLAHILGTSKYQVSPKQPGESEEEYVLRTECSICLCEFKTADEIRIMPCMHFFHSGCCDSWLLSHMECPSCRADIAALMDQRDD